MQMISEADCPNMEFEDDNNIENDVQNKINKINNIWNYIIV